MPSLAPSLMCHNTQIWPELGQVTGNWPQTFYSPQHQQQSTAASSLSQQHSDLSVHIPTQSTRNIINICDFKSENMIKFSECGMKGCKHSCYGKLWNVDKRIIWIWIQGTIGTYEQTLRKKKSVEEESSMVKSSEIIQKKSSFTKVKEKRKCSLNEEARANDNDQVS